MVVLCCCVIGEAERVKNEHLESMSVLCPHDSFRWIMASVHEGQGACLIAKAKAYSKEKLNARKAVAWNGGVHGAGRRWGEGEREKAC